MDIFGKVNSTHVLVPKTPNSPNKMKRETIPRGIEILHDPCLNKGTAFTERERDALGLRALLPPRVHNQDEQAECTAEQAYAWSDGRYVFASGSPFAPVTVGGKTFVPGQGNNAYVFPGLGLGVLASGSRLITDEAFLAAAGALAGEVTESDLAAGRVYPSLDRIREVSAKIAFAVADLAHRQGLAPGPTPPDLTARIEKLIYQPAYVEYM